MIPRERVLATLRCEEPDRVPFMEVQVDENVARQVLGLSDALEHRPQEPGPGEINLEPLGGRGYTLPQLAQRLGLDGFGYAIMAPSYSHKERSSSGREYLVGGPLKTRRDLGMVRLPDPDDEKLYEPARRFLAENRGDYAVFAFINLGADNVLLSMGWETFSYTLYDDPGLITDMLDMFTDWIAKTLDHICNLGFDLVWAADDLAYKGGPLFSPKVFREIFLPRLSKVARKIKLPWIFHSDGNLMPIMDDLLSLGMNGLHPIEPGAMDIAEVKRRYGSRLCLVGNIDLRYTLTRGTPEETEAEVRDRIREIAPGGGYIVSSANDIPSYCKPENLLAMSQAIRKYGMYPIRL
jgi:uroporphyrinogen decarboxylase